MSDLISREQAIEWVQNILDIHLYYHPYSKSRNVPIDDVIDRLERVPSIDAVQVIRCKDCEYWDTSWKPTRAKEGEYWCSAHDIYMGAEDYCSQAERRES